MSSSLDKRNPLCWAKVLPYAKIDTKAMTVKFQITHTFKDIPVDHDLRATCVNKLG